MENNSFEILCVTMNQKNVISIAEKMKISSRAVFANQCGKNAYEEKTYRNNIVKMISTDTIGTGVNRNVAMFYASADICLFSDDDMVYYDGYEKMILEEFDNSPKADIVIFNIDFVGGDRIQKKNKKSRKLGMFDKKSSGCVRIAFKRKSIMKKNIWFSTLFGPGQKYSSGEDSMWIRDAEKAKLTFYSSNKTIGYTDTSNSSWFRGFNSKFYYNKGAYLYATYPLLFCACKLYISIRTHKKTKLSFWERMKYMDFGKNGFKKMLSFEEWNNVNEK